MSRLPSPWTLQRNLVDRERAFIELLYEPDPVLRAVRDAVHTVARRRLNAAEVRAVRAVEARRRALLADRSEVPFVDFGSGLQGDRGAGEAAAGVRSSRTVGQLARVGSKSPRQALLLFQLVRHLAPSTCLELGSCVGVSGAYLACALGLLRRGRLVSLEGSPAVADVARRTFEALALDVEVVVGRFVDTLPAVLETLGTVDFVFVDGHHDGPATLGYTDLLARSCVPDTVLVYDDIRWSEGMWSAWTSLSHDPRFRLTVDLGTLGLAVWGPGPEPRALRLPL